MSKIIYALIPFVSLIVIFQTDTFITFGSIAFKILIIIMFSRPLRDIFPKKLSFLDKVVKKRKELGIIVGVFAIAHSLGYFFDTGISFSMIFNPNIWYLESYLAWGLVAFFVAIPTLLTSNKISVLKLGKHWKKVQYGAYLMFIFTILHIAFITEDGLIPNLSLLGIYLFVLALANYLNKKRLSESTSVKYICVPCSWIYDENLGDPDGGIAPGTKFEDIPDSWVCPVCGVGKKDFIKITGEIKKEFINADITKITYLNEKNDVIELIINTPKESTSKVGQFITFDMEDNEGEFSRSYSISESNGNDIKFLIKIYDDGRAGKLFKEMNEGDNLKVRGPFGDFSLNENDFEKVFIATGTGLAPIYNMLININPDIKKTLLFGIKSKDELFYIDRLQKIKNLEVKVFLSRENNLPENNNNIEYFSSRISIDILKNKEKNTDFYICGNPGVLNTMNTNLKNQGFQNIYFEKF